MCKQHTSTGVTFVVFLSDSRIFTSISPKGSIEISVNIFKFFAPVNLVPIFKLYGTSLDLRHTVQFKKNLLTFSCMFTIYKPIHAVLQFTIVVIFAWCPETSKVIFRSCAWRIASSTSREPFWIIGSLVGPKVLTSFWFTRKDIKNKRQLPQKNIPLPTLILYSVWSDLTSSRKASKRGWKSSWYWLSSLFSCFSSNVFFLRILFLTLMMKRRTNESFFIISRNACLYIFLFPLTISSRNSLLRTPKNSGCGYIAVMLSRLLSPQLASNSTCMCLIFLTLVTWLYGVLIE